MADEKAVDGEIEAAEELMEAEGSPVTPQETEAESAPVEEPTAEAPASRNSTASVQS